MGLINTLRKAKCFERSFILIKAPQDIAIESTSPSTLTITVTPNTASFGVTLYKVSGGGKPCEIAASMSPLSCSLTELTAATEYMVEAKACASASHCSKAITKESWTIPSGEFLTLVNV